MFLAGLPASPVKGIPAEIYASLVIMAIISVVCIIIFFKARRVDPLKRPKGILLLAEMGVEFVDKIVDNNMGKHMRVFAPYIMTLCMYIFLCFTIGLIGLPTPTTNYLVPLTLALLTFLLIHITSAYYKKWRYFKRYIDPFFFFLPVNLLSMWSPLLSLSFRLFGNAIAGWVLMSILYAFLESVSTAIFGLPYFIAPLITPFLHLYFDVFAGFIQTTVFVMITMLSINQEGPSDEDLAFIEQRQVVTKLN